MKELSIINGLFGHYISRLNRSELEKLETTALVVAVHRDRYQVFTHEGLQDAELTGQLRYSVDSSLELPCVGDWVQLLLVDEGFCIIKSVLPRFSLLKRKATGNISEQQAIAANIDFALIMMSVDRDFSIHRLQRYLVICHEAGINPILMISKIDTISKEALDDIKSHLGSFDTLPILYINNLKIEEVKSVENTLQAFHIYCLLGSSGVGKSTLINSLMGMNDQKTVEIGQGTQRGKHTTTHREIKLLANNAMVIDNPGMREVGLTNSSEGIQASFSEISGLAKNCKYKNCMHIHESGCAVLSALHTGEMDQDYYEHFVKLQKEVAHFTQTESEKRLKGKKLSKIIKEVKRSHGRY